MKSGAIWMELHALHKHGWTISALAREFGLNWRTVKRELESAEPRRYPERAKPTALTEAQRAHVERRLAVCPASRGTDLHAELVRGYGYGGSYPAFARHLRALRPARVRDPEIRFETDPGLQTQADWAVLGTWPVDGIMVELSAMVAILGCSRAPAIRFATDRTRATSLERLTRCLDDLGGTTREVLTDRDPAFCVGAMSDGRAILAPEWVDRSAVLGTVPKACRPYRAQTKGKVERPIRYLRQSFLYGRAFAGDADLNAQALAWLDQVANPRVHGTTGDVPRERFEREEQAVLGPLAARPYRSLVLLPEPAPLPPPGPRLPRIQVERRPLTAYAALAGAGG
jgi:transposase